MSQMRFFLVALLLVSQDLFLAGVYSSTKLMFTNKCEQTIWPGILSNAGVAPLDTTGFSLERGESKTISAPSSWGGRLWGRTQCTEDSAGQFSCVTGDCGSGKEECAGGNAAPPATLAEFTLDGSGGMDFYDVSLVDGYNLPMLVVPQGGSGANCSATGCRVDVNGLCPSALKVTSSEGDMVACKSACEAFGDPEYCCSGAFGTPDACKPSSYSMMFKGACPSAYSYAYDDRTSTFTCSGAPDYVITFCPSPNTSQKSSAAIADSGGVEEPAAGMDNSMVYDGALDVSGGVHPMGSSHVFSSDAIVGAMAIIATMYVITQS